MRALNPSRHSGAHEVRTTCAIAHRRISIFPGLVLRTIRNEGGYSFAFSRHDAPELCMNVRPKNRGRGALKRGAGNAGCPCTHGPCAKIVTHGSHHRFTGTPGISCAMVLTAYAALSSATNSSCHRHRRIKVHRNPVGLVHLRRFSTSNGCQDHTVLPYAATSTNPRVSHVLPTAFQQRRLSAVRPRAGRLLTGVSPPCIHRARRRCRVHRIPSQRP